MNLLIIGNGFDLAHGLPTKYSDFLDFLKEVESIAQFNTSLMLKKLSSEDKIKEYEKKAFVREFLIQINKSKTGDWKSSDGITQELFDNIKNNVWISYFQEINRKNKMKGINWIDFESEISQIIEIIDKEEENLYVPIPDSVLMEDYKISTFREKVRTRLSDKDKRVNEYTYKDLLDVTDSDILREIITLEETKTTIFYFDKQQQAQQIGNLVKMIGQAKFIEMVNSVPQRIVFQQQADMKEKS